MSELLVRRLGGNYSSINCTSAGGRWRLLSRAVNEPSRSFTVTCYGPTGNFKKLCHLISGKCETSRRFIDIDSSSPQLSGRHLDNRQVTTCCKPRAGPGIGWDQARLATAGYYRPGPGDGCQENMSSLQTSSQYFHVLSIGINYTEDLIHSGQSWLFIFLAVAQVQYISGVIINGPVMSLLSLSNFTEQPSQDQ